MIGDQIRVTFPAVKPPVGLCEQVRMVDVRGGSVWSFSADWAEPACKKVWDFTQQGFSAIQAGEIRTLLGMRPEYIELFKATETGQKWWAEQQRRAQLIRNYDSSFPAGTVGLFSPSGDLAGKVMGEKNWAAVHILKLVIEQIPQKASYNPSDADILKLPASIVVPLYYSLVQWKPCGYDFNPFEPNKLVSEGLDDFQAAYHEYNLRNRIYRLRTDMHLTVDMETGKQIPGIIDLSGMKFKPPCEDQSLVGQIVQGIVFAVIPALGWMKLAVDLYKTVDNIVELRAASKDATGLQKTVLDGALNLIENERISNAFGQPAPTLLQDVPNPSVVTQIAQTTPTAPAIPAVSVTPAQPASPITELSESLQPTVPLLTPAGHTDSGGGVALALGIGALILLVMPRK